MKVFISHSSKDKDFVVRLAGDLRMREGIDAWLDRWEISPGDKIPERIEEAISEAEAFIIVLSPDSVDSRWVEYERQTWLMMQIDEEKRAQEESRSPKLRLIPVLYRDCVKPAFLQPIEHVEITDQNYEDGFIRLVKAIRRESEKPPLKDKNMAASTTNVSPKKHALILLKVLLPSYFDEVVFNYEMPRAYLPTNAAQVQRAIALIQYALQQEGEDIPQLLEVIYQVAPHFKGGRYGSSRATS